MALFSGLPQTIWLVEPPGDRRMELIDDFWFEDRAGRHWTAPAARSSTVRQSRSRSGRRWDRPIPAAIGDKKVEADFQIATAIRFPRVGAGCW